MILSDGDIRRRLEAGDLVIEPLEDPELQIQPASVDFRLGREFLEFERTNISCIHPDSADEVAQYVSRTRVPPDDQATLEGFDGSDEADRVNDEFILHPGDFVLGTTIERVELPNDLIAHVEGRSSLGRLAVVVHASLPYDEPVFLWTPGSGFGFHPIGEVVERRVPARAVAFDPTTLRVRTHEVTDYITNPAKRIYRVTLESGRRVHVTRDHNLFTLDATGRVVRVASEDAEGTLVMVPGTLPAPATPETELDPFETSAPRSGVTSSSSADVTRPRAAEVGTSAPGRPAGSPRSEPLDDRASSRVAGSIALAAERGEEGVPVTPEFGWLFGFYVSAGRAAPGQLEFRNVNPASHDRVTRWFDRRDARPPIDAHGSEGWGLTIRSDHWSAFFRALAGTGQEKHLPDDVWNWSNDVLVALLGGLVDGSGFREGERDTVYTTDAELASRTMYLATRVGLSSSVTAVERATPPRSDDGPVGGPAWAVELTGGAHESAQQLPVPDDLLQSMRERSGLGPRQDTDGGDSTASASLARIERGDAETVRRSALRRLRERYDGAGPDGRRLDQLLDGDVRFERVTSVEATDRFETTYDLEVQPGGRAIENFIGGRGGVFLSNTAGIVDPGYRGQITLELSNLGSAPVALRPGMRISQLTFTELTSPADRPYGAGRGSKYQDQTGPQASRIQGDEEFGGDQ